MQFCCGSVVLVQLSSITGCSATGGPNWRLAFRIAGLLIFITDIHALGLKTAQGDRKGWRSLPILTVP
jgi:hypothetical protein